jgi:uncharacterized protein YdaU (DUF1376 family)
MHYYPKNIGDYRRDTMNLSLLEHGVYMTLIDHYILNEEPFPLDQLDVCWLIGARSEDEKTAVCLILSKFFIQTDNGYSHKRCDEEIAHYKLRADTARENGKRGGRPKPNNNPTLTQPLTNQEPRTNNQEPRTNKEDPLIKMDLFNSFWKTYPHRDGKKSTKKQSFSWWNKQSLDTLTMVLSKVKLYKSHIEKCLRDGVFESAPPDPIRYLQNERFNDDYKPTNSTYSNIK